MEIRAARQGVRASEEFAWNVDDFQVKVYEVEEPPGLSPVQFLSFTEVGQVFVVSEDLYRKGGAMKVVSP